MRACHYLSFILIIALAVGCDNSRSTETISEEEISDSTANVKSVENTSNSETAFKPDSILSEQEIEDSTDLSIAEDSLQSNLFAIDSSVIALIPKGLRDAGIIDFTLVPTETELGIANYPGSYIVVMGEPFTYNDKIYCTMELVSSSQPDVITAFYKDRKENWLYVEQNDVHTFKQDKDAYFRETNNLQIKPYDPTKYPGIDTLINFKPVSTIFIYYEVKNGKPTAMLN